jgi:hypothetical protein
MKAWLPWGVVLRRWRFVAMKEYIKALLYKDKPLAIAKNTFFQVVLRKQFSVWKCY